MGACAHNGASIEDREFDSNVFHFLILIKTYLILFTHTFTWFFFVHFPWLLMSGKVEASFEPRLSKIHPTNSKSKPLPMMGFKFINGFPPIHYGPFRPKVGIMAHLVVNDLFFYPFSFKEITHT